MFTWICPKCKMEVPPHLSECPNCAGTQDQPAAAGNGEPVSAAAPPAPQQAVPQQALPPRRSGLPGWVVSLLVAGGLVGGGALMYLFFLPGVPGEMVRMLEETVLPFLLERCRHRKVIRTRVLKVFGPSEAEVDYWVKEIDLARKREKNWRGSPVTSASSPFLAATTTALPTGASSGE